MEFLINTLKDWKKEANCNKVIQFNYSYNTGILIIYVSAPGYLIGKSGCLIERYTEILKKNLVNFTKIEFVQTDFYII